MAEDRRYFVGERVLVSRAQDGENHEEATVVDFYELLIEGDKIPSVVVDFDDGERLYLTAREPDVMPIELDDSDDDDDEDDDEDDEDDETRRRRGRRGGRRSSTPTTPSGGPGRTTTRDDELGMQAHGAGNRDDAGQERPRRDAQGRGDHGRRRRRAGEDRRGGRRGRR